MKVYSNDDPLVYFSGYLLGSGKPLYALALLGLIAPQVFFQVLIIETCLYHDIFLEYFLKLKWACMIIPSLASLILI